MAPHDIITDFYAGRLAFTVCFWRRMWDFITLWRYDTTLQWRNDDFSRSFMTELQTQ
jgi:hypothetical protein